MLITGRVYNVCLMTYETCTKVKQTQEVATFITAYS